MSAFNGPYGLTDIAVFPERTQRLHGSLALAVIPSVCSVGLELIDVRDAQLLTICDAFHRSGEDLELAMQYMADLAGAMTGMEVKVPEVGK